jgi:hypothetical protein
MSRPSASTGGPKMPPTAAPGLLIGIRYKAERTLFPSYQERYKDHVLTFLLLPNNHTVQSIFTIRGLLIQCKEQVDNIKFLDHLEC